MPAIDDALIAILCCPECRRGNLVPSEGSTDFLCQSCAVAFHTVRGRPILLRGDNELFPPAAYTGLPNTTNSGRDSVFSKLIPSPSVNLNGDRVLNEMVKALAKDGGRCVLVIGGGQQAKWLNRLFQESMELRLVYTDIDYSAETDLYCDAHDLPFIDGCFDGVVTTAVLEHVLYPEAVAAEIKRVLRPQGLLYSELPFMQQVHEGAYDFTRYTLSGHRRLFNSFEEIESGMVAGPGTALVWAIENFALAFVKRPMWRRLIKAAVRLSLGWIKHFDRMLINRPEAMDGASCTFFLGRRIEHQVADAEIVARYVGAKNLRHV